MTNVNEMLNKLFGGEKSNFRHKENLKYSEEEHEKVKKWMASAEGKLALESTLKSYQLTKSGLQDHPEMYLLNSPYANGFAIAYDPSISEKTFSNLFFAFGVRMLDLGYYRVGLDRTIREEADLVKTTDRQYFKPSVPADPGRKIDQRFGNVSIEKDLINGKPRFLKVLVTVYSGQHYRDAHPFEQFIKDLFTL